MEQNNQQFDNQYYQPNQPQRPQQPQPQYQPPQPQYQQYQQPVYQQLVYDPTKEVMSVGSYVLMFILLSIPVVNVICWIVWLVSPDTNKNKKNYDTTVQLKLMRTFLMRILRLKIVFSFYFPQNNV